MPVRRFALAIALLTAGTAGCGDDKPAKPLPSDVSPPPTPSPAAPADAPAATGGAYRVIPVDRGGTIAGACRLVGTPTPARFHEKAAMGITEGQNDGSVDVGEALALGGCVVAITDIEGGKEWPEAMRGERPSATIWVKRGRFEPHILLVRAATQIVFQGEVDTPDMNVHGYRSPGRGDTKFNFAIWAGQRIETEQAVLPDPGVYEVTEDSWSGYWCWIFASANPYAELTSAAPRQGRPAGEYRLDEVPPGDYTLLCWHEPMDRRERVIGTRKVADVLGPPIEIRRRVHVAAGATVTEDFDVPATSAAK